jgi:hypothetical protein
MLLPSSKRVTPQRPLFFGYCIGKNQNKPGKKQSFKNVNNQAIFTISDGDFGKYFHLPASVNFSKWILFTGKLPVNTKNLLTP